MAQDETGILLWIPMTEQYANQRHTTLTAIAANLAEQMRKSTGIEKVHAQLTQNRAPELRWKVGSRVIYINNRMMFLSDKQAILLTILWKANGSAIRLEHLPDQMRNDLAEEQSFRVAIYRLRQALGPYGGLIRSARAQGYVLENIENLRITE